MHTKFQVKRAYNEEMKNQKLICCLGSFSTSAEFWVKWVRNELLTHKTKVQDVENLLYPNCD